MNTPYDASAQLIHQSRVPRSADPKTQARRKKKEGESSVVSCYIPAKKKKKHLANTCISSPRNEPLPLSFLAGEITTQLTFTLSNSLAVRSLVRFALPLVGVCGLFRGRLRLGAEKGFQPTQHVRMQPGYTSTLALKVRRGI